MVTMSVQVFVTVFDNTQTLTQSGIARSTDAGPDASCFARQFEDLARSISVEIRDALVRKHGDAG